MSDEHLYKKAELVLGGDVRIPEGYSNPLFEYRDGKPYFVVLTFGKCRVRKRITDDGAFLLKPAGDSFILEKDGSLFLEGVGLKEMFCHSPDLAVISIGKDGEVRSTEEVLEIMKDYSGKMELEGVTLHGAEPCTKEHYVEVVGAVHKAYLKLNIGVGDYGYGKGDLESFKAAGASNYKLTYQTLVGRIAEILDSGFEAEKAYSRIKDAVDVFGRGNVVCTTYVGLGETDEEMGSVLERICSLGAMPDVKVKKLRDKTRAEMEAKLGRFDAVSPERYASIAEKSKQLMADNSLDASGYTTMCYGCRLCTLVPFKDF